jgi:hypothetical protein
MLFEGGGKGRSSLCFGVLFLLQKRPLLYLEGQDSKGKKAAAKDLNAWNALTEPYAKEI